VHLGEDADFDPRFKDVAADLSSTPALQSDMRDQDTAVSCKWGGDPREEVSALIVCATLVRNFDSLVQQGNGDALLSFEQLVAKAKAGWIRKFNRSGTSAGVCPFRLFFVFSGHHFYRSYGFRYIEPGFSTFLGLEFFAEIDRLVMSG